MVKTKTVSKKKIFKCDTCGKMISEYEYKKNKGLCNICVDIIQ